MENIEGDMTTMKEELAEIKSSLATFTQIAATMQEMVAEANAAKAVAEEARDRAEIKLTQKKAAQRSGKPSRRSVSIGSVMAELPSGSDSDQNADGTTNGSSTSDITMKFDVLDLDMQIKVVKMIQSALHEKHSGKHDDHERYIDAIMTAFTQRGIGIIMTDSDTAWEDFKYNHFAIAGAIETITIDILQSTLSSKGAALAR